MLLIEEDSLLNPHYISDFNDEIIESREDAEAALAKIPEIREKIDEANTLTDNAKAALGEAKAVAKQASDKALQAKDIAESVKEVIPIVNCYELFCIWTSLSRNSSALWRYSDK